MEKEYTMTERDSREQNVDCAATVAEYLNGHLAIW
jgi:hypothetical protein